MASDVLLFYNTLISLLECTKHMDDHLSIDESAAREHLIELCKQIAADHNDNDLPGLEA